MSRTVRVALCVVCMEGMRNTAICFNHTVVILRLLKYIKAKVTIAASDVGGQIAISVLVLQIHVNKI
jgi:hypothetical protein